jgi:hypothetical protein
MALGRMQLTWLVCGQDVSEEETLLGDSVGLAPNSEVE